MHSRVSPSRGTSDKSLIKGVLQINAALHFCWLENYKGYQKYFTAGSNNMYMILFYFFTEAMLQNLFSSLDMYLLSKEVNLYYAFSTVSSILCKR